MKKTVVSIWIIVATAGWSGHAQNLILNGSFESPTVSPNSHSTTAPTSWLATGPFVGIINGDYGPGNPLPEDGQQYAWIKNSSSLSQSFTIGSSRTYELTWFDSSEFNGPGAIAPYSIFVTDGAGVAGAPEAVNGP